MNSYDACYFSAIFILQAHDFYQFFLLFTFKSNRLLKNILAHIFIGHDVNNVSDYSVLNYQQIENDLICY